MDCTRINVLRRNDGMNQNIRKSIVGSMPFVATSKARVVRDSGSDALF
jgi:hypothetical protein